MHQTTSDIRNYFVKQLEYKNFVKDKSGCDMIELVGASFIADEPSIFGTVNEDYVNREIDWYTSMSLNVNDIPAPVPKIWKDVATADGYINSNYGYLIFSSDNYDQFMSCKETLERDPTSRRAIMIYTRPSIQFEYNRAGMSDFICTNAVQYFIRDDKLHALVQMRSNDLVFGYKNDWAWNKHVLDLLSKELGVPTGDIYWQVGSLHVYSRHFNLVKLDA